MEEGDHFPAVIAGGTCLVSTDFDALQCGSSHPQAQRLCPCAPLTAIKELVAAGDDAAVAAAADGTEGVGLPLVPPAGMSVGSTASAAADTP